MHLYEVGYGTCEESSFVQLWHRRKFSCAELEDIILDCLVNVFKLSADNDNKENILLREDNIRGNGHPHVSIQYLLPNNIDFVEEMGKKGFIKVEYECRCTLFGWSNALDPNDWPHHADNQTRRIQKELIRRLDNEGIRFQRFLCDFSYIGREYNLKTSTTVGRTIREYHKKPTNWLLRRNRRRIKRKKQ